MKSIKLVFLAILLILFFKTKAGNEWQLYAEKNGVKIFYKYTECHNEKEGSHKEYILFRFENTTDIKLKAEWDRRIWYDGKCMNCGSTSPEYHNSIELKPGESIEACCDTGSLRALKICSRILNYKDMPVVTRFEFENLSVNPSN